MLEILWLSAAEILDARGRPTLEVEVEIFDGPNGIAQVPAGVSIGTRQAHELRDGDSSHFRGQGVRRAVQSVKGEIAAAVRGQRFDCLSDLDEALVRLDGTPDKSRLGANALIGVSMAVARAVAAQSETPLWSSLAPSDVMPRMPVPFFSVISGGPQASNDLAFRGFMIAPLGAPSVTEAIRAGVEVYEQLREVLSERGLSTALGDDGGFAPQLSSPEAALRLIVESITAARYDVGPNGVAIALDPAASRLYRDEQYDVGAQVLSSDEMVEWYADLVDRYPIWSIEDGLAEDDVRGWQHLTARLGDRVQIIGGQIFGTNEQLIRTGIEQQTANAALIKPSQVGTVSETLEAMSTCRRGGWAQIVSHRSGDTCDSFIADLAVASGCGQIKSGAPVRGESVAKYNRLSRIESDNPHLEFGFKP